jgi:hypothetical protein
MKHVKDFYLKLKKVSYNEMNEKEKNEERETKTKLKLFISCFYCTGGKIYKEEKTFQRFKS